MNFNAITAIVDEILKDKIARLKENKERIRIRAYFEKTGQPDGAVLFTISKKTTNGTSIITLSEIHEIHQRMQAEIRASFTGKNYQQYVVIPYQTPVIYF